MTSQPEQTILGKEYHEIRNQEDVSSVDGAATVVIACVQTKCYFVERWS